MPGDTSPCASMVSGHYHVARICVEKFLLRLAAYRRRWLKAARNGRRWFRCCESCARNQHGDYKEASNATVKYAGETCSRPATVCSSSDMMAVPLR